MSTDHPDWEHVALTRRNDIVEVRFHTGDGPLLWDADAHRETYEVFHWLAADREVKVVIVTGTGDSYCTELDTVSFAEMAWDELWWEGRRMLNAIDDIDAPIISAVNGPALIHSEVPIMADIVLAAEHAEFADRAHFALRDTVPGDGVNLVWGELLGPIRSKYFLMTGSSLTAQDGLRIGFVNEVLPLDQLNARAWELAEDLAKRSLPVLRYTKAALKVGFRKDFNEGLSHSMGVEGGGHWSRGGIKPGQYSGSDS